MPDPVAVRFLKPSLPYNAGEVAWFGEEQAASLIKQGFAEREKGSVKFQRAPSRAEILEQQSADHSARMAMAFASLGPVGGATKS